MANDIEIRAGMDTSQVSKAITAVKSDVKSFAQSTANSWKEAFTVGAVVAGFQELVAKMKEIKRTAEDVGTSTDFLQTLEKMAVKFGGTAEDANAALIKLAETIGQARMEGGAAAEKFAKFGIELYKAGGVAKTTEEIFKEIATAYRGSEDAATKAALAFEFFGRTGRNINNILAEGAVGIDALTEKYKTFGAIVSSENIDRLIEVSNDLKVFGVTVGSVVGWVLRLIDAINQLGYSFMYLSNGFPKFFESLDRLFGGSLFGVPIDNEQVVRASVQAQEIARATGARIADINERIEKEKRDAAAKTEEDKLKNLEAERDLILNKIERTRDVVKLKELELELVKKHNEIEKQNGKIKDGQRAEFDRRVKAEQDALKVLMQLEKEAANVRGGKAEFEQTVADRVKFTAAELRGANLRGVFNPEVRESVLKMRQVDDLRARAERLRIGQRGAEAAELFGQADMIESSIKNLRRSEMTGLFKEMQGVNQQITELNERAKGDGIVIAEVKLAK